MRVYHIRKITQILHLSKSNLGLSQCNHYFYLFNFARSGSVDGRKTDNAGSLQRDVAEVERDLSLRKLLWESSDQWTCVVKEWKELPFDCLNVDEMQKTVSKLMQTVFLLEKGRMNHLIKINKTLHFI